MIPVKLAPEPVDFDIKVRQPGLRAIAEMTGSQPKMRRKSGKAFKKIVSRPEDLRSKDFPQYWTEILPDLMAAYDQICAYSCFRIHPVTGGGTVDHFLPKSLYWRDVYEWKNYRLASQRMNSRKADWMSISDPCQIKTGWFQLELPGFDVIPNPQCDSTTQTICKHTIEQLGLNDFSKDRALDATRYKMKEISLSVLRQESPFVASELHRLNLLNSGDTWL